MTQSLHSVAWVEVSGASDAPKSTVRAMISLIPVPDPTPAYVTGMLSLDSNAGFQYFSTSGWTRVEPAPVIVAPALAVATELPTVARTAALVAMPTNLVRVKGVPFESRPFTHTSIDGVRPRLVAKLLRRFEKVVIARVSWPRGCVAGVHCRACRSARLPSAVCGHGRESLRGRSGSGTGSATDPLRLVCASGRSRLLRIG